MRRVELNSTRKGISPHPTSEFCNRDIIFVLKGVSKRQQKFAPVKYSVLLNSNRNTPIQFPSGEPHCRSEFPAATAATIKIPKNQQKKSLNRCCSGCEVETACPA